MNKKILIYLTAISLFLISCADNSNDINTEKSTAQTNHYKVRGDNKYDVLGFGFDATGE
jgi:thioredoxin-related protein